MLCWEGMTLFFFSIPNDEGLVLRRLLFARFGGVAAQLLAALRASTRKLIVAATFLRWVCRVSLLAPVSAQLRLFLLFWREAVSAKDVWSGEETDLGGGRARRCRG